MTPRHVTRHSLLLALATLAALALIAPAWPGARIAVATGAVELGRGEPPIWQPAAAGDALAAGDRVRTGEDGRAEIALERSTLRLYPNSMLRLPETAGAAAVELDEGTSLFDVLRRGDAFEVRTPEVVVSVKGTRFAVALGAEHVASVSVFRGLVGVRGDEDVDETLVQAGFAAVGDDEFELSWHGADDPWESWGIGDAAPDFLDRHPQREAALRDAYSAAQALARELPQAPRPTVAERDATLDSPAALAPDALGDADEKLSPGQDKKGGVVRDPVANASGKLKHKLEENLVETLVNGGNGNGTGNGNSNGNGGSGGVVPLTITYIDGSGQSGSDRVQIDDPLGNVWTLDEDEVEEIAEGELGLPPNLAALVQARGLTDSAFAQQLERLFD